jgi:chaperone modulatory protein CbpM
MNAQAVEVAWLDARETISLAELSRTCGLSAQDLGELIDYGAIVPIRGSTTLFSAECVVPLRTAGRMRQDFDLDLFTVSLLLNYLHRIDVLEREVRALRARLPAHVQGGLREHPETWHEPHG